MIDGAGFCPIVSTFAAAVMPRNPLPEEQAMFKRRAKIIDRKFQLRTTLTVIGVTLIAFLVIIALAGIIAARNSREIRNAIAGINGSIAEDQGIGDRAARVEALKRHGSALQDSAKRNFYLISLILAAVLIQSVVLYFYLIRVTHRISGPIYVISRYIEQIMEGRHPEFRALRDKDEFKEFYAKFVEMVEKLEKERHEES